MLQKNATGHTFNLACTPALCPGSEVNYVGYNTSYLLEFCKRPFDQTATNWCDQCVELFAIITDDPVTNEVDTTLPLLLIEDNVRAMGTFDWHALLVASVLIGATITSELRDVKLCLLALQKAEGVGKAWSTALSALAAVRRFLFLPILTLAVPILICLKGGDALSVALNSVALLFLTEGALCPFALLLA